MLTRRPARLSLAAMAAIIFAAAWLRPVNTSAQPNVALGQTGSVPASVSVSADSGSVPSKVSVEVLASARSDLSALSSFYAFSKIGRVRIALASSPGQFRTLTGTDSGDVLAVADESSGRILISPASWRGDPSRVGGVLMHELSHLVLGAKFKAAGTNLPRWLDEGMAQYVAGDWEFDIDWTAQQSQIMEAAAASGRLVPMGRLDALFTGNRGDVQLAYAQSYSFVSYLASTYGQRSLRLFLDGAARPGTTLDGAARQAFGVGMDSLESAWQDSTASRSRWWDVLLQGSNFSVLLWSTLAVLVIIGFVAVTLRKRKAYAGMEEGMREHEDWDGANDDDVEEEISASGSQESPDDNVSERLRPGR